ncbi:LacI family DNA-binding transcriptional regulator [Schleiferilactobacillus harbinensis]|uniref:LacI family DNA-binding transcriptional regulator n=1 Tax=Schleiferilactobacillus harbinensis TaxID=304207 RepID=UPI0021BF5542|nr:LacI family DNA-binding transcriptional regulator [Schleiferilactobacillus harbinensis]
MARLAQTSKSTVSRVISGKGYVSQEKRQAILAAIDTLHYVPSQAARNMRRQQTHIISFLISDYFQLAGEFLTAFGKAADAQGYHVNVYFTQTAERELTVLNGLMDHSLDAAFLLTRLNHWDRLTPYTQFGPLATWQRVDSPVIYSSYVDHYPLYMQLLRRLAAQGYRRIGSVFTGTRHANTQAKLKALKDFQAEDPAVDTSWIQYHEGQHGAGSQAADVWLTTPQRPDAVICFSDYVAAAFIAHLREAGIRVPQDVAVVGMDNSEISRLMGITTVDLHIEAQAENDFAYLYNQLNEPQQLMKPVVPKIIERQTTNY